MRRLGAIGAVIVGGVAACSGQQAAAPSQTIVETDNPTLPSRFAGSASVSKDGDQLLLTITNVQGGASSCDDANAGATSTIANLFNLEVRVNALSSSGDIVYGTYSNASATFTSADYKCVRAGRVMGLANVQLVASGTGVAGTLAARFPGNIFVIEYQGPVCGPPAIPADAGSSCVTLPSCTPDAGDPSLCLDFP